MTNEDPDFEWVKQVASLFRGLYEDKVFNKAVASIEGMPASSEVPMPNTSHPAYADMHVDLAKIGYLLRIRVPGKPSFVSLNDETYPKPEMQFPMVDHILTRQEMCGPAPFVGDARWEKGLYFWNAWVDELGRHIAGDAHMEIIQRPIMTRYR